MRRVKKKPLRASVTQNNARSMGEDAPGWFGFGARLGLLVAACVFVIGGSIWLWQSSWPGSQARAAEDFFYRMTQRLHFSLKDVTVEGRRNTDRTDLLAAISASEGAPILALDLGQIHDRLAALTWVHAVSVERRLPDTLSVLIEEREPLARWQHDGALDVIDREGAPIAAAKPESFAALPLVVGNDAPARTAELLADLNAYPAVAAVMKAAVRVSERRWNLYVRPNILVRLPETGQRAAMGRLAGLIKDQKILDRDIVAVDLTQADRLAFERGTSTPEKAGETRP